MAAQVVEGHWHGPMMPCELLDPWRTGRSVHVPYGGAAASIGLGHTRFRMRGLTRTGPRLPCATPKPATTPWEADRKSVDQGKSVSDRVEIGGRRIHKKKK